MYRFKMFVTMVLVAAMAGAGLAQGGDAASEEKEKRKEKQKEIVVTATKTSIDPRETGASITVITEKELEQKGKRTVESALRDVPGIIVASQSPFGGLTSAYIRGAESGSSIVLIDGVRVNDPTNPTKQFDFGYLLADNLDRIEVIRGSQSTLYGSDAMGGVINIITKKGHGDAKFNVWAEAGAYNTFREMASVSGGTENAFYSLSITRIDSEGMNTIVRGPKDAGRYVDKDGYKNTSVSTRLGIKLIRDSWLTLSIKYIDARIEIDDGAANDDINRRNETELFSGTASYAMPVFDWWESTLIFSYMNILRRDRDPADAYDTAEDVDAWYRGSIRKGEWRNKFSIGEVDEILFGAEIEQESASTHPFYGFTPVTGIEKKTITGAAYIQNHLKLIDRIFFIAGIRYTSPQHYDDEVNYNFSGSFIVPVTETRIKANIGSGFKTPTLYQRFDTYDGNRDLNTEKSVSYDLGFEQPLIDGTLMAGITYFHIIYSDLIHYDNSLYKYINVDAESQGIESFLRYTPIEDITLIASYTYTWAINNETDKQMLRRPEHSAAFNANYSFIERGNINVGLTYVGERLDYTIYNWPQTEKLSPYWRLDAAVSFWILDELQVFARGENLLNQDYEEANGYNTPGISFYGGVRARL